MLLWDIFNYLVLHFKICLRVPSQCKLHIRMRKKVAYLWKESLLIGLKSSKLDLFLFSSVINKKNGIRTVQVKIQWTGEIGRTKEYIFFYLTPWRLESMHAYSENILSMMKHGSRFYTIHLLYYFFLGFWSDLPVVYVDPFRFMCHYALTY